MAGFRAGAFKAAKKFPKVWKASSLPASCRFWCRKEWMAARSYPPISVSEPVRAEGGIDGAGGGWVVTESGTATIGDSVVGPRKSPSVTGRV